MGRQFLDWSADYRLFSRSPWNPHALFDPIFDHLAELLPSEQAPVVAALDDTLCKKTGRHIPGAPLVKVRCFAAGAVRDIPIKILRNVYWCKAGPDLRLLLVVIKPLGYRLRKGSKMLYRQPAFLICTDPELDLQTLLQAYVDRWEIECNHRDEKSLIGVAQGQVWS